MKKRILKISLGIGTILAGAYLIRENGRLSGIVKNQEHTIEGLMKEVKNLTYHLGKKSI